MLKINFPKLPRNQQILYLAKWGVPYKEIAAMFGFKHHYTVSRICVKLGYEKPHSERITGPKNG